MSVPETRDARINASGGTGVSKVFTDHAAAWEAYRTIGQPAVTIAL